MEAREDVLHELSGSSVVHLRLRRSRPEHAVEREALRSLAAPARQSDRPAVRCDVHARSPGPRRLCGMVGWPKPSEDPAGRNGRFSRS